jgi:hypothetical protein
LLIRLLSTIMLQLKKRLKIYDLFLKNAEVK